MKPFTAETLFDLVELDDVRVSTDGASVVFVKTSLNRAANAYHRTIWLRDAHSDAPAQPLTSSTKDSHPRWSPDGTRLAFLSGRDDKPAVFVLPQHGEARQIATHPNGVRGFVWSPDSTRLAFTAGVRPDERAAEDTPAAEAPGAKDALSGKHDKERREQADKDRFDPRLTTRVPYRLGTAYVDDRWPHVYVAAVPSSFAEPNTAKPKRVTGDAFDSGTGAIAWSPDGASLLGTMTREPENARWYAYHDLIRIPLDPAEIPTRLTTAGYSCNNPLPSPDGRWIAFDRIDEDNLGHKPRVLTVMPTGGGASLMLTESLDRSLVNVAWRADSAYVYFTLERNGAVNLWRVRVPPAQSAQDELESIAFSTEIKGRLIDDLGFSPRALAALKKSGVRTVGELITFKDAGRQLPIELDAIPEQLTTDTHDVTSFDVASDGRVFFIAATPTDPSALYVRETDGTIHALERPNAKILSDITLAPVERIVYPSDDYQIDGWLLRPPPAADGTKPPLVVEIHGGPHIQWTPSYRSMFAEWQLLAARGYAVFFCNPRGADGYGTAFTAANWKDWATGPMRDILAGVDTLVARGDVDPERLHITGGSYGGYMTAWIVAHDARFRSALSERGVYNLISIRGTSDIPVFFDFEMGLTAWDDVAALWRMSPIAHVANINTPLLISHSELDYRVPVEQAEQLFQSLWLLKKPVELLRYPREGHELSRSGEPKHRIDRLERMLAWFDKH
jgi:dipeptidyl aminopeptidase/acylaminoacyl peptidase